MKISIYILLAGFLLGMPACKKYLEEKSDQSLATPDTFEDLQAILDGPDLRRAMSESNESADEYYMDHVILSSLSARYQDIYTWNVQADYGVSSYDWSYQYRTIFNVNAVLDNLARVNPGGQSEKWNAIKGTALFVRAHGFYQLAQVYAEQYEAATANNDLGICLRLSSDFNVPSARATIQQTYDQIISDLLGAADLLPITTAYPTRPGKPAAYALLARVYLTMGDYDKAKNYATECLNLHNKLLDFNSLDSNSLNPIPPLHEEVLYYTQGSFLNSLPYPYTMIDSAIASSYDINDLRKVIYMVQNPDNTFSYKRISNNGNYVFNGIAVDEVLLTRAECYARKGDVAAAMLDLNKLLEKRWKTGTFIPYAASNPDQALTLILQERKKELLNRGTRWTDIRRLNKDPRFSITLKRVLGSQTYTLPPNNPSYVLLIPQEVIDIAGIQQNPR